jgi:hypothetical protein
LVTHLTSLILVDETGDAQAGVPAMRKVPLATPRAGVSSGVEELQSYCLYEGSFDAIRFAIRPTPTRGLQQRHRRLSDRVAAPSWGLADLASRIPWDLAPARLQKGDPSMLDPAVAQAIRRAAAMDEVAAVARELGLDPLVLVIAIIARFDPKQRRTAVRIADAVLRGRPDYEVERITSVLDCI